MAELNLPLLVEPQDLQPHLGDPRLLIVDLSEPPHFTARHVPGAVNLPYQAIIQAAPPVMGLLPSEERLSQVFSVLGLSEDRHVVGYDAEGNGRASRLLWTLDVLGHAHFSLLNGGLLAWASAGMPMQSGPVPLKASQYQARIRKPDAVADAAYIQSRLGDAGTVVLDARSANEFSGADRRAQRAGHIPGAVNIDWLRTMDPARDRRLLPDDQLRALLEQAGVTPDKEVIVHCQTHHRSAHTYVLLKHLGYPKVRGYAGSWSEWGNRQDTPVES